MDDINTSLPQSIRRNDPQVQQPKLCSVAAMLPCRNALQRRLEPNDFPALHISYPEPTLLSGLLPRGFRECSRQEHSWSRTFILCLPFFLIVMLMLDTQKLLSLCSKHSITFMLQYIRIKSRSQREKDYLEPARESPFSPKPGARLNKMLILVERSLSFG